MTDSLPPADPASPSDDEPTGPVDPGADPPEVPVHDDADSDGWEPL